jgi:endonuclease YncB( thermonuclease family)
MAPSTAISKLLLSEDVLHLERPDWRAPGQQIACGTMSLAALEALIAGVKVRCEVVERDRHGRLVAKVYSSQRVDIGRRLASAGWRAGGTRWTTSAPRTRPKAKRGMWRGL